MEVFIGTQMTIQTFQVKNRKILKLIFQTKICWIFHVNFTKSWALVAFAEGYPGNKITASAQLWMLSGMESKVLYQFVQKEKLKVVHLHAGMKWGSYDPATDTWDGMVGNVRKGLTVLGTDWKKEDMWWLVCSFSKGITKSIAFSLLLTLCAWDIIKICGCEF